MRVVELWRYPVKSLQGERLDSVAVSGAGLEGDRRFALFDARTGVGLTARRMPALLFASGHLRVDGTVEIRLPDGTTAPDDDALSRWLGRPVTLRAADAGARPRYESPVDFEDETTSAWTSYDGASIAFHDAAAARVSLLSTAAVNGWAPRRFRANLLVDDGDEDGLVGSRVAVGDALLDVGMHLKRCVMTTRPQPGGIERDLDVLRTVNRERHGYLAVGATVARPGTVRVGDVVRPVEA